MVVEIELKLQIAKEDIAQLYSHALLANLFSQKREEHLTSTYFDTLEHDLKNHGYALRIRQCGNQLLQTVKSTGEILNDLHQRQEWEQSVTSTYPNLVSLVDDDLRTQLMAIIGEKKLVPLFQTEFLRRSWQLELSDKTKVELALDQGEIIAGNLKEPISEIELELKEGSPAKLNEIANDLKRVIPLKVEYLSKAERGYRLCQL